MRRNVLLRSVMGLIGPNVEVIDAAYMWRRHRWVTYYATAVFAGIVMLAPIAGIDDWATRVVIGLAGVAVAVNATTDYRVVSQTSRGMILFKASRIRQVATARLEDLGRSGDLMQVGGTIIAADWKVGDETYTVARSSQQAMERMAVAQSMP